MVCSCMNKTKNKEKIHFTNPTLKQFVSRT